MSKSSSFLAVGPVCLFVFLPPASAPGEYEMHRFSEEPTPRILGLSAAASQTEEATASSMLQEDGNRTQPRSSIHEPELQDADQDFEMGRQPIELEHMMIGCGNFEEEKRPILDEEQGPDTHESGRAQVTLGSLVVRGSLDREIIERIFRENLPAIRKCYLRELDREPGMGGEVKVGMVITSAGSVSAISMGEYTTGNEGVDSCLLEVIRSLRFPGTCAGLVIVTVPLTFSPERDDDEVADGTSPASSADTDP